MINIKTPEEIKIMAEGCHKTAAIRDYLATLVKPGITTKDLDQAAYDEITKAGGVPSFLNHEGFPASICASVNEEVVHGIPNDIPLENGDIVSIDIGMFYKGFHSDTAITVPVGEVSEDVKKLIKATKKSLAAGLKEVKAGIPLGNVENAIQKTIEMYHFGIVRELTGHGVGRELQEEPSIPNYGKKGTGPILQEGMVLAIEPMVTLGSPKVAVLEDNWTIVTQDGSYSAHFEHTVAVTKSGCQILTI